MDNNNTADSGKLLFAEGAVWRSPRNIYYKVVRRGPEITAAAGGAQAAPVHQMTLENVDNKRKIRRNSNATAGWTYITPCYSEGIISEDKKSLGISNDL